MIEVAWDDIVEWERRAQFDMPKSGSRVILWEPVVLLQQLARPPVTDYAAAYTASPATVAQLLVPHEFIEEVVTARGSVVSCSELPPAFLPPVPKQFPRFNTRH
jgi:hypothetical protein